MTDSTLSGSSTGYQITTKYPQLSDSVAWPREAGGTQLDEFYGNPRGSGGANSIWEAANLVEIQCPWTFKGGGHSIRIHQRCADSLKRVLEAVWEFVGKDQGRIATDHLDEFGGSYNYRTNVNAPSKLSLHGYGAALDWAPDHNANGKDWQDNSGMLPRYFIDAFLSEGWCWGGDFSSTKDPMHFQATFNTHKDAVPLAATPTQVQPAVMPDVPIPQVAATSDQHLARMRQFLLDETGIAAEVETFKSGLLIELEVLKAKISAYSVTMQLPAPQVPMVVPPTVKPPLIIKGPILTPTVQKFTRITATEFGGAGDEQASAYSDVLPGWPDRPGVALPFRFSGIRPKVNVVASGGTGEGIICEIVDVGPWNINDPYWTTTGGRPQAESGTDTRGRRTNLAGIDLTPAAASALGIDGKGLVDWSFITAAGSPVAQSSGGKTMSTPAQVTVPVQSALASKINWTSIVQIAATLLTVFTGGKIGLTADQQAMIVGVIGTIAPLATIAFRTFGTTTITPQSLPSQ